MIVEARRKYEPRRILAHAPARATSLDEVTDFLVRWRRVSPPPPLTHPDNPDRSQIEIDQWTGGRELCRNRPRMAQDYWNRGGKAGQ